MKWRTFPIAKPQFHSFPSLSLYNEEQEKGKDELEWESEEEEDGEEDQAYKG